MRTQATKTHQYDIGRIFALGALGLPLDGIEAEFSQQLARDNSEPHDAMRPRVPWSALANRTALIAGSGPAAGFLIETETMSPLDALRPYSVVAQAGISELPNLQANVAIPRTTSLSSGGWMSSESTPESVSAPALGQVSFTPHIYIGVIEISRQLLLQAPTASAYIRRELARTAGAAIDTAVIAGTGASGQPIGAISQAGTTISGASFSHTTSATMKADLATANTADQRIGFLSTPAVRLLLEQRQTFTGGSEVIWRADQVSDRPAAVSTVMPSATMVAANWAEITLASWGQGFEIELNPFDPNNFKSGVVQARIYFACDVGVLHPGAVVVANSIT